ncbi:hypothetical protein [Neorhizobium tomejilense]|uniref:Nmad2 family putative nucleotide modification protein n=1 Tax=Neorhizobium tomejilense TaxID=2093828 RepID=UPI000CF92E93|nr:hypothetical protein [Neorhizobium tomejilense]
MALFAYVTRWDHGFAPNPFFGVLTLATCKPDIRKKAAVGDWIVGTGSAERKMNGRAIFAMRVTEMTNFDDYWRDERFRAKKPVVEGSYKLRFGDNIYHRVDRAGAWIQADSRHSKDNAVANEKNLNRDTNKTDRVLLSDDFIYWGDQAPMLPAGLEGLHLGHPGHKEYFTQGEIDAFNAWVAGLNQRGRIGDPIDWADRYARRWK